MKGRLDFERKASRSFRNRIKLGKIKKRQGFAALIGAVAGPGKGINVYPVHVTIRKSLGLMMRKLSVTESQSSAQFRGTFSRRKPSVASANWAQVT